MSEAENRYYSKEFQKFIGKTRQTFAKIKQNKERCSKYANDFISLKFGNNSTEELELILLLFIEKKKKKKKKTICWNSHRYLKSKLFSMLYKFNTQKMLKFLKHSGFAKMLLEYLNILDVISTIPKLEDVQKYEDFLDCICYVQKACINSLAQNK